jgi:hypothetical protein
MSERQKTYGSITMSKRAKQKLMNASIDLWLAWGIDYDGMRAAIDKHELTKQANESIAVMDAMLSEEMT